jgi:Ca-activated chloride channel homolog
MAMKQRKYLSLFVTSDNLMSVIAIISLAIKMLMWQNHLVIINPERSYMVCRLLFVAINILVFLMTMGGVSAQETINVTVFIDEDSLTVYIPDGESVSLRGFGFEVTIDNQTTAYLLESYPAFSISFDNLSAPICFRLIRNDSSMTSPTQCPSNITLTQLLQSGEVFWHDKSANQRRTLILIPNTLAVKFLPAGVDNLSISFPQPTPTASPTSTPTDTPSVTPPTLTPTPIPPNLRIRVTIEIVFAPESAAYMEGNNGILAQFNAKACDQGVDPRNDQPLPTFICITGKSGSSGTVAQGIINAITNTTNGNVERPVIFQPSVSDWLKLVNYRTGQQVFNINNPYNLTDRLESRATTREPVILAIWESRLRAIEAKTGKTRDQIGWQDLLDVQNSPNGWCDYAVPNCRRAVLMGFTDPNISSTALSSLIAQYYFATNVRNIPLDMSAVVAPGITEKVQNIQHLARHYAQNTVVFRQYLGRGPDYLDFVPLEENDLIFINQGRSDIGFPPEPLIALYPQEGTFFHERPMGIVNANWVTPEQQEAARYFVDYTVSEPVQRLIMSYGFRPADTSIQLDNTFWDNCNIPLCGVAPGDPPTILQSPSPEVIEAVQTSWRDVKKRTNLVMLVDISGSMCDPTCEKLDKAKEAALAFLQTNALDLEDSIALITFNKQIVVNVSFGKLSEVGTRVQNAIFDLPQGDPNAFNDTALYNALLEAIQALNQGDKDRIQAIVLLSDGQDTQGIITITPVLTAIQDSWKTPNPIFVIPIAYGSNADTATLDQIGNTSFIVDSATGNGFFAGDVPNIADLLRRISTYF